MNDIKTLHTKINQKSKILDLRGDIDYAAMLELYNAYLNGKLYD